MPTQTCRLCRRPAECTKAQFCRYPLRGYPESIWQERRPWVITTATGIFIGVFVGLFIAHSNNICHF
jgi:hypothetical protein